MEPGAHGGEHRDEVRHALTVSEIELKVLKVLASSSIFYREIKVPIKMFKSCEGGSQVFAKFKKGSKVVRGYHKIFIECLLINNKCFIIVNYYILN